MSNASHHCSAATLSPAAAARSSVVSTSHDDHLAALPYAHQHSGGRPARSVIADHQHNEPCCRTRLLVRALVLARAPESRRLVHGRRDARDDPWLLVITCDLGATRSDLARGRATARPEDPPIRVLIAEEAPPAPVDDADPGLRRHSPDPAMEYTVGLAQESDVASVTHSQGGLILQRSLTWMLHKRRGRELARIRSIVMLACPTGGSEYFDLSADPRVRLPPAAGSQSSILPRCGRNACSGLYPDQSGLLDSPSLATAVRGGSRWDIQVIKPGPMR
jgi:hypothetical protein